MSKTIKISNKFKSASAMLNIKNINLPARSSVFFTLTNLICKGFAFLFTPIFTRLLSPADYGEFSLFSTFLSLSAVAVTMEISGGIIMRLFQKERELQFLSILCAWLISIAAAIPTTIFLWLIQKSTGFGMNFPFAYVMLFFSLISISIINLYVSRCKFRYSWAPPLITALAQSVLAPIVSIAVLRISYLSNANHVSLKISAVTAVLSTVALCIAILTVARAKEELRAQDKSSLNALSFFCASSRFLLKLALPLLPYYLSIIALSQADKLFISSFMGRGELAKYSVAYSAGVALTALTSGVMGALSPWIMRRTRAGEYERIRQVLSRITSASVPIIVIFLCFAPDLFSFLAPKEYGSALPVLFISAMIPIPLALAQCSSSIAIAKERVGGVLFSGIFPAIMTLALNFLTINRAPLHVPAIITAVGFITLAALGIANIRKITGYCTVNVNKTFQNLLFLITLSTTVYSFKEFIFIRASIVTFSFLVLTLMIKPTLSLLKETHT